MYEKGEGVEQNYSEAIECYWKAAELGNSRAFCYLASLLENGEGFDQDLQKGLEFYQMDGKLGDSNALFNLGVL